MDFLDELFFGNIEISELPPKDSKDYKRAYSIFCECEEQLTESLSGKDKKTFLQLIEAHNALNLETCKSNFKRGCRFAMEIMKSCFEGEI